VALKGNLRILFKAISHSTLNLTPINLIRSILAVVGQTFTILLNKNARHALWTPTTQLNADKGRSRAQQG
jgi:hypothetical protein